MLSGRVFKRFVDMYDQASLDRLFKANMNDIDGRAFLGFSMKELKKRVSPELWESITKDDPLSKIPELEDVYDFEDLVPHFHHTIPPHLSKPALLLNERQRAAKRMTLEYIKDEKVLMEQRTRALTEYPVMSEDYFEVLAGVMIVRDPIWILYNEKDVDWLKIRYKTQMEHGKLANMKLKDFEYEKIESNQETETVIRLRKIVRMLDNNEDLVYTPIKGSSHYLEANYNESDPHNIAYAGGYRAWLMVKEKETGNWGFPKIKMTGVQNFTDSKKKIVKEQLENKLKIHMLGPSAVKVDVFKYDPPRKVERPRYITEDIYDLYVKRSKILFPNASDDDIAKFLSKKYRLNPVTEPAIREVQGQKTFYFRALYNSGTFSLKSDSIYSDWAWVPKLEMNKYLDERSYNSLIRAMTKI